MIVLKSVLLLLLMSYYVPVSCQDPNPCERVRKGKVPHPTSCTKYYDCDNYRAREKSCTSREHYSTKARGCVPISQSVCVRTTTPVPTTQATTIRKLGSGLVSKPECSLNTTNLDLFNQHEHLGKTYYLSKDIYTTDVASAAICETMCGYLAEIDNKDEGELVTTLLKSEDSTGILIGGTDKFEEGQWTYERTGKRINYFDWCNGDPTNYTDEHCLGYTKELSCMWDYTCFRHASFPLRYLCEVN